MAHRLPRRLALSAAFVVAAGIVTAMPLDDDEELVLVPTVAERRGERWKVEVDAWVFESEPRRGLLTPLRHALGLGDLDADEAATFAERARAFLVDNERGRAISIRIGGAVHPLGKTAADGHVRARLVLPGHALVVGRNDFFAVETPAVGEIFALAEEGLSVISDIDDTIKVSAVRDRGELLRNTFVRPFQPVVGMASVYGALAEHGATFHYVSAGPELLYPALQQFRQAYGFPAGSFHLQRIRLKDRTALGLFDDPDDHKQQVIGDLLDRFPKRRFLLIGDSGERDPEIYARLARRHRAQIAGIWIHDLGDEPPGRFDRAFGDLPKALCVTFRDPAEIDLAQFVSD